MLLISDLPGTTIPRVLLSQILPQMIMVETMIIMKKKIPKIQKKVAQQYIIFFIFLLSYSLLFWFSDLNKCRQLGRRLPWVSLFLFFIELLLFNFQFFTFQNIFRFMISFLDNMANVGKSKFDQKQRIRAKIIIEKITWCYWAGRKCSRNNETAGYNWFSCCSRKGFIS